MVPRTARTNEKTVYRLREGQPDRITFQPGLSDNKYMEILSGDIKPGDALITEDNKPRKDDQKSGGGGAGSSFKVRMF